MPNKQSELKDPREWVKDLDIESTEDIAVPKMLVDQVIGLSLIHISEPTRR